MGTPLDSVLLAALRKDALFADTCCDLRWLEHLCPSARDAAQAARAAAADAGIPLSHETWALEQGTRVRANLRAWRLDSTEPGTDPWLMLLERDTRVVPRDLDTFIRHLPFPTTIRTADDTMHAVSAAAYSYFQRDQNEIRGQKAKEVRRNEFEDAVNSNHRRMMSQVFASGTAADEEFEFPHPDGPRRVRLVIFPLDPPGTRDPRIGSQLVDLTRNHSYRIALEREQARGEALDATLQAFILDSPVLMTLKDPEGRYIGVSHGVSKEFNRAPSDFIGKTDHEVILAPGAGELRHQADLAVLAHGSPTVAEETFPLVPGLTLHVIRYPLHAPDGTALGIGGVGVDISELKRTQALAEEQTRQLEEFTYAAAHDLKEPLRTVTAYLSLLVDEFPGTDASAQLRYLNSALASATRMGSLINGLLQLASINRAEASASLVALSAVVRDSLDDLHDTLLLQGAEISVDGNLPTVPGNAVQLRQVLMNLISNGVKFRHPDRVPQIRIIGSAADGRLQLRVADNGIGIAKEHHERVFKVFERLHPRSRYDGQGIGLAVCRAVLARHAGSVYIEPTPDGEGTCVVLDLPMAAELPDGSAAPG